jgi:hypothetical protein
MIKFQSIFAACIVGLLLVGCGANSNSTYYGQIAKGVGKQVERTP